MATMVIVNCATGETQEVVLSANDQSAYQPDPAGAQAAAEAWLAARTVDPTQRAAAIQTVLTAPAITADPALVAALAHLLGA